MSDDKSKAKSKPPSDAQSNDVPSRPTPATTSFQRNEGEGQAIPKRPTPRVVRLQEGRKQRRDGKPLDE
jgi:hypothetical protein